MRELREFCSSVESIVFDVLRGCLIPVGWDVILSEGKIHEAPQKV
jgi:hypothetical protein